MPEPSTRAAPCLTVDKLQDHLGLPRLILLEHEHTRALCRAELEWVQPLIADISSGRLTWDVYLRWVGLDATDYLLGGDERRPARLPPAIKEYDSNQQV